MDKFIAREDVRAILGDGKRSWEDCNMTVHTYLLGDWVLNLQPNVILRKIDNFHYSPLSLMSAMISHIRNYVSSSLLQP